MEENYSIDEKAKLQLEAARLKCQLLEIKKQLKMINQETKKKMKESSPAPLKERKETRKEAGLNNYNNKKRNFKNPKKENYQEPLFVPPTLEEVQAYMDEIGESRFTALKFWNYYEAKGWILGKTKMRYWKCVLDNWAHSENEKAGRHKRATTQAAQKNVVTFNAFQHINNEGAINILEYERMKKNLNG